MNKKDVFTTLFGSVCMVYIPAFAQESRWASADDPVAKQLIEMERMWSASNCSPQPGLKDVFADEFRGTSPEGIRYGKADAIQTDMKNLHRECKLGEVKVQFFGDNVAIAYGEESSIHKEDGKDVKRCLKWTDTWLKRNGKWQIITATDVRVKCPE